VTWIGERDIEVVKNGRRAGPIANFLSNPPSAIDRVVVLHERSEQALLGDFLAWIRTRTDAEISQHSMPDIEDSSAYTQLYPEVHRIVHAELGRDLAKTVYLNGSSGRPVKHAIFMLLATPNSRLQLVSCWSDSRPVSVLELPFAVAVDFARSTTSHTINAFSSGRPLSEEERLAFSDITGDSDAMQSAKRMAASFAAHNIAVMIFGETGTGKELFAEAIHRASSRSSRRFVPVNCGAIPEALVDAELFGARKGSYTGADRDRSGLFQQANGGTLFLDEIGELPLPSQARLLRALSTSPSRIRPVGGLDEVEVDVRVIAATHRDIPSMVATGKFRQDLWYRLSTAVVRLPPLRERGRDIETLIDLNWQRLLSGTSGLAARTLTAEAKRALRQHSWPGNVRELLATLTRIAIRAERADVSAHEVKMAIEPMLAAPNGASLLDRPIGQGLLDIHAVLNEVKHHYIGRALAASGGNKSQAALALGIPNSTLSDWLRELPKRAQPPRR
jgi:transcriptional regulator with PAS, ATPase and Fis domain